MNKKQITFVSEMNKKMEKTYWIWNIVESLQRENKRHKRKNKQKLFTSKQVTFF